MNPIVRNILAAVVGFVVGNVVNMALIIIGPMVIPLPEGADVSTPEKLRASIPLFGPSNFIFPFLAHALGTLVGAFVAVKIAASHHMKFAIGMGVAFLLCGIANAIMVGGPLWFNICDLVLAFIPMGLLGGILAGARKRSTQHNSITPQNN